jgi:hypothetical protein
LQYFTSLWNLTDSFQFFAFIAFVGARISNEFKPYSKTKDKELSVILLQFFLIGLGFLKMLFFIRIYKKYGQLVNMVADTVQGLIPFLAFFFLWVLIFGFLFWILQVEINNADTEYLSL